MAALKGQPQRAHFTTRPRENLHWQEQASCQYTDPEVFFPPVGRQVAVGARRVCSGCPVRAECLEYALTHGEWYGIWGGLSVDERQAISRERRTRRKRSTS